MRFLTKSFLYGWGGILNSKHISKKNTTGEEMLKKIASTVLVVFTRKKMKQELRYCLLQYTLIYIV